MLTQHAPPASLDEPATRPRHPSPRPGAQPQPYPLIPGRLSFAAHATAEVTRDEMAKYPAKFFISSDFQDCYAPFCLDFGPVNLAVVHKFCAFAREIWGHENVQDRDIVYFSWDTLSGRTNSAFLLAAFMVLDLGYAPEDAWAPFAAMPRGSFATYRDATGFEQKYGLTVLACIKGLQKAHSLGWYSSEDFSAETYMALQSHKGGDMHVVSPKFVAFKGPVDPSAQPTADGIVDDYALPPAHYAEVFKGMGVSAVVRLNEASTYDSKCFTEEGINHHDIYFDDCTMPDSATVRAFLKAVDEEEGVVAVHCLAGLGRTGTLIAVYFMEHHGFTAAEAIGWLRIVRPGSVIGDQQHFLHWYEATRGGRVRTNLPKAQLFAILGDTRSFPSQRPAEIGRALKRAQNERTRRDAGNAPTNDLGLPGARQAAAAAAQVERVVSRGHTLLKGALRTIAGMAM